MRYIYLAFIFFSAAILITFQDNLFSLDDIIELPKTGHRKPAILFDHKLHSENYVAKCVECHHKGNEEKCSDCHLKRDQGNIINIKGAYHQQCRDCHRKTSGPKACGRCHKKIKRN